MESHTEKSPGRSAAIVIAFFGGIFFLSFGVGQTGQTGSPSAEPAKADQELASRVSHMFQEVTKKALPAVVSISSVKTIRLDQLGHPTFGENGGPNGKGDSAASTGNGLDTTAEEEWVDDPDIMGTDGNPKVVGMGSGFVIRSDGMILTNNHVVENSEHLVVTLDEKHKARATVVGTDPKTDLAVIHIERPLSSPGPVSPFTNLPTLSFGNSEELKVGDLAIAIGSPFGLSRSASFGIISAKGRAQMGVLDTEDFIQTDAAINPGSSGGPLLNTKGEVIGITTAIYSQGGGFAGIGFAIPSKIAREVSEQLLAKGHVSRGWIGVVAQDLDEDLSQHFGSGPQGALISQVTSSGPAEKSDLKAGDVVTSVNKKPVEDSSHLKSLIAHTPIGQNLSLEVVRYGKRMTLKTTTQEEPSVKKTRLQQAGVAAQEAKKKGEKPTLGIMVEDIPDEILQFFGGKIEAGVIIVGVHPGTPAFDAGLFSGDIVLSVNRKDVHNTKEFAKALKEVKQDAPTVLYIQRGADDRLFVPVRVS